MRIIWTLTVLLLFSNLAHAVNIAFVPGDAFYPSTLKYVDFESFEKDGLSFEYRYPPSMRFSFCGYAGFQKLRITGNTEKLIKNLKLCYRVNREIFPKELIEQSDGTLRETNGLLLLIYNRNVGWSSNGLRLGIKYNENWNDYPDNAFTKVPKRMKLKAYIYNTFVKTADAVIHDWQHAEEFSGLKVTVPPETGWGYPGPKIEVPLTIDAAEVQIVVLAFDHLESLFQQKDRDDFEVVNNDGYFRHTYVVKGLNDTAVFQQKWDESNDWIPEEVPTFLIDQSETELMEMMRSE